MRAAILSLMGIAPTAVLGANYLATNTSQFLGVMDETHGDFTPILVGNGTDVQDKAATIQISDGILEVAKPINGTVRKWQIAVNDASGSLVVATAQNGVSPTPGFSFTKDGKLVFENDTANHDFRGCHSAGSTWPAIVLWQSIHDPLTEYCFHLSLTKVEA